MNEDLKSYRGELRKRSRPIHGQGFVHARDELARVAKWCEEHGIEQDVYGNGELIEGFEAKLATLFGHESARFLPSGTMAQGIAMRLWCGSGGHFGMHPTCHLELHEERGYDQLLGLHATLLGPARRPMLAQDLERVAEHLDALIIELPTRENGGQLPSWEQLVELTTLARERGIKLHLDGARAWEAQAAYGRPFTELGALFDSIYVSFYKGIGALSGAMLIGPSDFIAEARSWQRRMGGNLYTLLPNVASAAMRFDAQLARFPAYRERTPSLGAALARVEGVNVLPDPPQVNMLHVLLGLGPEEALAARDRVAEETGLWLFGNARAEQLPGDSRFELYVGEAAMEISDEDLEAAFRALFAQ